MAGGQLANVRALPTHDEQVLVPVRARGRHPEDDLASRGGFRLEAVAVLETRLEHRPPARRQFATAQRDAVDRCGSSRLSLHREKRTLEDESAPTARPAG